MSSVLETLVILEAIRTTMRMKLNNIIMENDSNNDLFYHKQNCSTKTDF